MKQGHIMMKKLAVASLFAFTLSPVFANEFGSSMNKVEPDIYKFELKNNKDVQAATFAIINSHQTGVENWVAQDVVSDWSGNKPEIQKVQTGFEIVLTPTKMNDNFIGIS